MSQRVSHSHRLLNTPTTSFCSQQNGTTSDSLFCCLPADCPVKNVMFTKEEFDGKLAGLSVGLSGKSGYCSSCHWPLMVMARNCSLLVQQPQHAIMLNLLLLLYNLPAAVSKVMDLATTMQEKGVSQKCQDEAIENLASCATDDSMAVKQGCCSQDCSKGIKAVSWWWLRGRWFGLLAAATHRLVQPPLFCLAASQ